MNLIQLGLIYPIEDPIKERLSRKNPLSLSRRTFPLLGSRQKSTMESWTDVNVEWNDKSTMESWTDVNVEWNDVPEFDPGTPDSPDFDSDGEDRRERNDYNIEKEAMDFVDEHPFLKRIMHCGVCGAPNHNSRFHKKNPKKPFVSGESSQPEASKGVSA
ncbi:hypothetical protein DY000_02047686 [Brassica cretica]|uniref:Uncharacterized protein n=1 Tax=Brassica cretica TaxID=69181 RepID=A0ABQ7ET65_BRACR|nr:hypothetical protein DY000_02047686 [Brassica cretica]